VRTRSPCPDFLSALQLVWVLVVDASARKELR
jgi:hypothetical protein